MTIEPGGLLILVLASGYIVLALYGKYRRIKGAWEDAKQGIKEPRQLPSDFD